MALAGVMWRIARIDSSTNHARCGQVRARGPESVSIGFGGRLAVKPEDKRITADLALPCSQILEMPRTLNSR
jgi:hypothetical protein